MPVERIPVPTDGMNTGASPDYLSPRQARDLKNLIPCEGRLRMRGPMVKYYPLGASNATAWSAWSFNNKLLLRSDAHRVIDFGVQSVTSISPAKSMDLVNGRNDRHARVGDVVYGAISPTSGLQVDMGVWNPATNAITAVANAPVDWIDLKYHQRRLFVLGGSVPGTTTPAKQYNLYWSDQDGPTAGTLAQWQDDDSGLVNQLTYAAADTPIGLARCGRSLAILMRRSVYLLTGDGPSSYAIRLALSDVGCIDAKSIAESAEGFYFMSDQGFCYFDGAGLRRISAPIDATIISAANAYRAAILPGGCVSLSVANSLRYDTFMANTEQPAWWRLSSAAFTHTSGVLGEPGPAALYRLTDYVAAFDARDVWDATYVAQPGVFNGGGEAAYSDDYTPNNTYITTTYTTRTAKLSSPINMSTLSRVHLDYTFLTNGTPNPLKAQLEVVNDYALLGTFEVPTDLTYGLRKRFQMEVMGEADAVYLRVTFDGQSTNGFVHWTPELNQVSSFELYDSYVEYEPGRPRPTL